MRKRAKREYKSINQISLETLERGLGLTDEEIIGHDLDDLADFCHFEHLPQIPKL